MKRILIVFLVLAMLAVPVSSFAFRGNGGHGGRGSSHGGAVNNHRDGNRGYGYHRGGGNFWPGVGTGIGAAIIYDAVRTRHYYSPPPQVYVSSPAPYYRDSYDSMYELEMERLRQEEYRERQRLQAEQERLRQEQAREDARRDFYGRYRR